MRKLLLGSLMVALVAFLGLAGSSCSDHSQVAPTKTEITLEPGVYDVDHPELFKLAPVTTRSLPAVLTANGAVTPDVNRTIHVTSQGSGRLAGTCRA